MAVAVEVETDLGEVEDQLTENSKSGIQYFMYLNDQFITLDSQKDCLIDVCCKL